MEATITLTEDADPGGAKTITNQVESAFRKANINALVRYDDTHYTVTVEGDVSKKRLQSILNHVDVPHHADYEEDNKKKESGVPDDYYKNKQRIRNQREQIRTQKGEMKGLEKKLEDKERIHKNEVRTLQAKLKDAESRASHPTDVNDFVSDIVGRERKAWEGIVEFYTTTVETASEIYGVDQDSLREEILEHTPLEETTEYQEMEEEVKAAREAMHTAEQNPFVQIGEEARDLLKKVRGMEEREEGISDTREDLEGYFEDKKMRILISKQEGETSVIIPFAYRGDSVSDYSEMERPVLTAVKESLDQSKADYEVNRFENVVKFDLYNVPGEGKRVRNRIVRAISSCQDAFTRLGGDREVVRIEVG